MHAVVLAAAVLAAVVLAAVVLPALVLPAVKIGYKRLNSMEPACLGVKFLNPTLS